jgi:hypothetical protein
MRSAGHVVERLFSRPFRRFGDGKATMADKPAKGAPLATQLVSAFLLMREKIA